MNDKTENLQADDFNKEEFFEQNVRPLIRQMYDLCEANGIPFVAAFAYGLDTTVEGEGCNQRFHMGGSCHLPADMRAPCEMRVAQTLMFEGFDAAKREFFAHVAAAASGMRESYTEREGQVPGSNAIN